MDVIAYMQACEVLFSFQATSGYIDIENRKNSRCHLIFLMLDMIGKKNMKKMLAIL